MVEAVSQTFVYGKYHKAVCDPAGATYTCGSPAAADPPDFSDNSYWLYSPANIPAGVTLPIMIEFHGGGLTGGTAKTEINPVIQAYLDASPDAIPTTTCLNMIRLTDCLCLQNGFHYMSVNYRLVGTTYVYDSVGHKGATTIEEEWISVTEDGTLTL